MHLVILTSWQNSKLQFVLINKTIYTSDSPHNIPHAILDFLSAGYFYLEIIANQPC